ncbi:MAG TPA: Ig-like domain-containing protein [Solirubrobacteraceae bacterium]|jgi:hypothetical protein|nr:Ig-like domain-containing protein [Solirubrobacteraceae bacterium]
METAPLMRVLRGLFGSLVVALVVLSVVPAGAAIASVTLESSPGGTTSNDSTPTFSGTASDFLDPVTLLVYSGNHIEGSPVRTLTAEPAVGTGAWTVTVTPSLSDGTYTAVIEQDELLGLGETSTTPPVTFTIDTASPKVSLDSVASPSNQTEPAFTGTASDTEPITIDIYEGGKAEGIPVSSASASGTGGSWKSTGASPSLLSGEYTAVATQPSSLGNAPGRSNPVTFAVSTASPTVTLNPVASPSNNTEPTFSGTASDAEPVTVHIYEGSKAEGTTVATATASGNGGGWSSAAASPPLASGTYTAIATQPSSLGNAPGKSNTVKFDVSTASPTVTLNSVASPSNDTTPVFTGKASDTTSVTVEIFEGSTAEGTVVATATAPGNGGSWSSGHASPALSSGTYTALATQPSSLGNAPGKSNTVTFVVSTASPTVTLSQPTSPSNNTTPTFSGSASEAGPVTVQIYEGSKAGGTVVSSAGASATGGGWTSGHASPALASGTYTAVATEPSSLGNSPGRSNAVTFAVSTASPVVTLNTPTSPSNQTRPTFSGFASDTTQVVVKVYAGTSATGTVVATATAEGNGGDWSSGEASPQLSSGQYTAIAVQTSSLGNAPGQSNTVTFTVNTAPPTVTLNPPKTPSNNTAPTFSGTASDTEPVMVHIYAGSNAEGTPVSTAAANGNGGAWSSGQASPSLVSGQYTAVAVQASSLGNSPGTSSPVTFVVDTSSPTVSLNQPPSPSNNAKPAFTGTASDTTQVVVHIYDEASFEVTKATATPSAGAFSASNETTLANGTYTATATQQSSLGNPEGKSSTVTFVVNTSPPTVTLNSPAFRSNNTTPSFTGTASDTTLVTVRVYAGTKAEGAPVSTLTAPGTGAGWESGAVSPALSNGTYTAIASQPSSLGNPEGKSAPATFTVDTHAPTVTLTPLKSPTNSTAPTFTGSASEVGQPVAIKIYAGTKASGTVVAAAEAAGNGGEWTSSKATPALVEGTYTAIAIQTSAIKNPSGESAPVTFTVETKSPTVTLSALAKPLSNNTTPSFSGTASDVQPVTVQIYAGLKAEGTPVSTATGTVLGGIWSSGPSTPALASGQYSAIAEQPSSAGNAPGLSKPITFTVNTAPPTVALAQPKSPSNNTKPAFTGTASDTTQVVVHIYNKESLEVTKATATPSAGAFSASNETTLASGTYTATATQKSSLGNPDGTSSTVTFVVNTSPPTVTLSAPPSPSNNAKPTFTGTASDTTTVTVTIWAGVHATGSPIATATGTPDAGGSWTSGAPSHELLKTKQIYTAVATEPSSIGNPSGASAPIHFEVDPGAPTVTLNAPPSPSNSTTPSFTGSASDTTPVTIEIYAGAKVEGKPKAVSTAAATGTRGGWTSGAASPPLPDGSYTVVASQYNLANPEEVGTSERYTFTVETVPPHVTLTAPANGSSTTGTTETVTGTAGSEEGDSHQVTVQLFSGSTIGAGQSPVQSVTVNASGNAWSATFGGLTPGTYTTRAAQSDWAGNVGLSASSTFTVVGQPPAASQSAPAAPPSVSFTWFPTSPRVGQSVSLVSNSTDAASAITGFAWDMAGAGAFVAGGPTTSTTFSTPGNHRVQLRVTDANGASTVASAVVSVTSQLPLMQPFPIVRITGTGTRSGIKLTQLGVSASPGTQITVQCRGRGCPSRAQTVKVQSQAAKARKRSPFVEFSRFERSLKAGITLEIRASKPGLIGKYTRFVVRKGRLPLRFDACLEGIAASPVGCSSS